MISILMPIYNGIEFINESVTSIISQTFSNWELIIGINGHFRNSDVYNIAKKYKKNDNRIIVIDLYTIKGKSNALNEMLKYCKYEWISLLDVDDKWLPSKLNNQLQYMDKYDVIGTLCQYFGDSDIIPMIPTGDLDNYEFLSCNPIINSSCLLRKELCYWDNSDSCHGIEDYDLWIRLNKNKKRFYNICTIEVLHRIHKESAFNAKGNNKNVKELIKKYSVLKN